ncbi:MAG TPA: substrate-binding domain-containing protein [Polyangiaceae bacterium]
MAAAAGITRQSLSAIEAGRSRPAVDVALAIARALDSTVEELFSGDEPAPLVTESADRLGAGRVAVANIGGRWVSYRLEADATSLSADGIARGGARGRAEVETLRRQEELRENVVVMGCAPALGMLVDRLNARSGAGRFLWFSRSSTSALEELAGRRAHVAGVHLVDSKTGEANVPDVRRHAGGRHLVLFTLASWEAGLLVAKGNPRNVRSVGDLSQRGLRIAAREKGSGARRLLERELRHAGLTLDLERGSLRAAGQLEVARAIRLGAADTGVATRDAAIAFGHDFIPLASERYDLALPLDDLADPRLARLIDALTTTPVRRELAALGYDVGAAGTRVAEIRAA